MLIIARLFAAALYQASSSRALRASKSQKVAAKSPWDEKRVEGRKVEGLTRAEGPEGVPQLWGLCRMSTGGNPGQREGVPQNPWATRVGDQLTGMGRTMSFSVWTGSFAFQACILPPASAVALCRKEPSAAQRRSSHSIPAPHLLGAPARRAHAQEGGPGAECSCPSAGECQEPCEPARPLWEPQAASHSPNLPGY